MGTYNILAADFKCAIFQCLTKGRDEDHLDPDQDSIDNVFVVSIISRET